MQTTLSIVLNTLQARRHESLLFAARLHAVAAVLVDRKVCSWGDLRRAEKMVLKRLPRKERLAVEKLSAAAWKEPG